MTSSASALDSDIAISQSIPSADSSPPPTKREYDGDVDSPEVPNKKRKFTIEGGRAVASNGRPRKNSNAGHTSQLGQLKRGLDYVSTSSAFSDEAKEHARRLFEILYATKDTGSGTVDLETSSTLDAPSGAAEQEEIEDDVKNPHTNVPPPFALPDKKNFTRGPGPALESLNQSSPPKSPLPPLPTAHNYQTTKLVTAPTTTVLPQVPQITDVALANAPFMHTSALPAYVAPTGTNSYEPLEFLGDAYLEIIATRLIHSRFPLHSVGQKAGLRELLIKNETLAEYSQAYGFGERVQSAHKERHGVTWTKVLGDVFEAYLACIIIQDADSNAGFIKAEQWLTELWAPKILQWRAAGDGTQDMSKSAQPQDAKTDLNRLLVGKEAKLEYRETKPMQLVKEGNRTTFYMGVYLTGWGFNNQHLGSGEGRSKQIAGTNAAEDALRTSQDIIQMAHTRKVSFERQFKKGPQNNKHKPRGGGGGPGHRPHFNQPPIMQGVGYPNLPQPPMRPTNFGPHGGFYQQGYGPGYQG